MEEFNLSQLLDVPDHERRAYKFMAEVEALNIHFGGLTRSQRAALDTDEILFGVDAINITHSPTDISDSDIIELAKEESEFGLIGMRLQDELNANAIESTTQNRIEVFVGVGVGAEGKLRVANVVSAISELIKQNGGITEPGFDDIDGYVYPLMPDVLWVQFVVTFTS